MKISKISDTCSMREICKENLHLLCEANYNKSPQDHHHSIDNNEPINRYDKEPINRCELISIPTPSYKGCEVYCIYLNL